MKLKLQLEVLGKKVKKIVIKWVRRLLDCEKESSQPASFDLYDSQSAPMEISRLYSSIDSRFAAGNWFLCLDNHYLGQKDKHYFITSGDDNDTKIYSTTKPKFKLPMLIPKAQKHNQLKSLLTKIHHCMGSEMDLVNLKWQAFMGFAIATALRDIPKKELRALVNCVYDPNLHALFNLKTHAFSKKGNVTFSQLKTLYEQLKCGGLRFDQITKVAMSGDSVQLTVKQDGANIREYTAKLEKISKDEYRFTLGDRADIFINLVHLYVLIKQMWVTETKVLATTIQVILLSIWIMIALECIDPLTLASLNESLNQMIDNMIFRNQVFANWTQLQVALKAEIRSAWETFVYSKSGQCFTQEQIVSLLAVTLPVTVIRTTSSTIATNSKNGHLPKLDYREKLKLCEEASQILKKSFRNFADKLPQSMDLSAFCVPTKNPFELSSSVEDFEMDSENPFYTQSKDVQVAAQEAEDLASINPFDECSAGNPFDMDEEKIDKCFTAPLAKMEVTTNPFYD
ncbi:hypothetical protein Ciccas_010839 [Cichlidogyrus casuarinus]|uniref:Uncharacterized protein n=1 Tax=Cichlidogyrus casuarinus TaxID=1844966 RepID=A0ABD2PT30_9PLAT